MPRISPARASASSAVCGELDAAGLPAAAGEDLRLHDHREAELVRRGSRLGWVEGETALRHRDPVLPEELLPLVLVEVQGARESTARPARAVRAGVRASPRIEPLLAHRAARARGDVRRLRAGHERAAPARRRSERRAERRRRPADRDSRLDASRTARAGTRSCSRSTGSRSPRRAGTRASESTTAPRSAGSSHRARRRKARSASSSSRPATRTSSTSAIGAARCRRSVPRRTTLRSSRGSSSPERRGKGRCPREGHSSPGAMRA